ncbi:MAG: MBL fold metallo-hydrolase [Candidatus Altiarchaeota archaeon]|nr:MBL fold metallo-hydrolase [Candidatus Altiarchaeota archaeon]
MIHPFFSPGFESNCFLAVGEKAAIIDAGIPQGVLDKVGELGIGVDYLISTHTHFDHVLGLARLRGETGAVVAVHEADAAALESGDSGRILSGLFGALCPKVDVGLRLRDGDVIDLGGIVLEVVHTPGHTPGSICLYEPASKALFSGDTVFADGVGRTDFPGGSFSDLKRSVERLVRLHEESGIGTVYPGHGPPFSGDAIEDIYETYF